MSRKAGGYAGSPSTIQPATERNHWQEFLVPEHPSVGAEIRSVTTALCTETSFPSSEKRPPSGAIALPDVKNVGGVSKMGVWAKVVGGLACPEYPRQHSGLGGVVEEIRLVCSLRSGGRLVAWPVRRRVPQDLPLCARPHRPNTYSVALLAQPSTSLSPEKGKRPLN